MRLTGKQIAGVASILGGFDLLYLVFLHPLTSGIIHAFETIGSEAVAVNPITHVISSVQGTVSNYVGNLTNNGPMGIIENIAGAPWVSVGSIISMVILLAITGLILFAAFKPKPPANKILDDMPEWSGTNFDGNGRWLRSRKEIVRAFDLKQVPLESLKTMRTGDIKDGGLYVGEMDGQALLSTSEHHLFLMAESGAGKSRRILMKQLVTLILSGESFACFDTKCELFPALRPFLERQGVPINRIDYSKIAKSSRENPMQFLNAIYYGTPELSRKINRMKSDGKDAYEGDFEADLLTLETELGDRYDQAEKEALDICKAIFPRDRSKEGGNSFFSDHAQEIILMGLHYVASNPVIPLGAKTVPTVSFLIETWLEAKEVRPRDERRFSPWIEVVRNMPASHPAYKQMMKFAGDYKHINEFRSTAIGALTNYTAGELRRMMSGTDFPLTDLATDQPTATFIILPNDSEAYDDLGVLYINQLMHASARAAREHGGRLPIRMNIIAEELYNMPVLEEITNWLSLYRGYNIRFVLVVQSKTLLESKYRREATDGMLANCAIKLFLKVGDANTGKYISDELGYYDVLKDSTGISNDKNTFIGGRTSTNTQTTKRLLLTPQEAMKWDPNEGGILFAGGSPACVPAPGLELTVFNDILGLGTKEENNRIFAEQVERPMRDGQLRAQEWSLELNTRAKAEGSWTDDETKAMRQQFVKRQLRRWLERISAEDAEAKKMSMQMEGRAATPKPGNSKGTPARGAVNDTNSDNYGMF